MEEGIAHLELFFGIDLVVFIGLIALTLFIFTALINRINRSILRKRGKMIRPRWHHWIAILAIIVVIIHVGIQFI